MPRRCGRFPKYDAFKVGYWRGEKPEFCGVMFDAVIGCHVIEHLAEPASFVRWALSRLTSHGRRYLEWPSELSIDLPARGISVGAVMPLFISRFREDTIQHELTDRSQIASAIYDSGGVVEVVGMIRCRWVEEEPLTHWQSGNADLRALQVAHWSRRKWSQCIIAGRQSSL